MVYVPSPDRLILRQVLDLLDKMLSDGKFTEVDGYLTDFNVEQAGPLVLIGILTLTSYGKEKMAARPAFLVRAEARLRTEMGDARAERLLANRR